MNLKIKEKMQPQTRSQKISKIAAKTIIRIFIIILFFGILPFMSGDQPWEARVSSAHLFIPNKWTLAYPALLFVGFITLTVICMKTKYTRPDLNWLLVLNGVILTIYLVLLYTRIYKMLMV